MYIFLSIWVVPLFYCVMFNCNIPSKNNFIIQCQGQFCSILYCCFQLIFVIFQSFEIVRKLDCPDPEIQTRYLIKFTVVSLISFSQTSPRKSHEERKILQYQFSLLMCDHYIYSAAQANFMFLLPQRNMVSPITHRGIVNHLSCEISRSLQINLYERSYHKACKKNSGLNGI